MLFCAAPCQGKKRATRFLAALDRAGICLGLLAVAAAYVWTHLQADFTFPTPWGDEVHFLRQAIAFQERWSLFSPELDPRRPVLWMPPGYMVAAGLAFKLCGFSYALARHLSMICVLGAGLNLYLLCAFYGLRWPALALTGALLLGERFLIAGNVARMEGLLLLVVTTGFLLLQRRRRWGLPLLALSPLVHPNGLFFLAAGWLTRRLRGQAAAGRSPSRSPGARLRAWAPWVIVGVLWGAYLLLIAAHPLGFLQDMSYQLSRKAARSWRLVAFGGYRPLLAVALIICLALARREGHGHVFLLGLAAPAWVAYKLGREMWYECYDATALLLMEMVLLLTLDRLLDRRTGRGRRAGNGVSSIMHHIRDSAADSGASAAYFTDLVLNIALLCLRPNRLVSLHLHPPRPPRSANVVHD
jgi:hypothetical protein